MALQDCEPRKTEVCKTSHDFEIKEDTQFLAQLKNIGQDSRIAYLSSKTNTWK